MAQFEALLSRWAQQFPAAEPESTPDAWASDGKSLRGSQKGGAAGAHLLSAVSQQLGLTVANVP